MTTPKILVSGGRDFNNWELLRDTLYIACRDRGWESPPDEYGNSLPNVIIVHGGARGADDLADQWAVVNWCVVEEYKADWKHEGKAAGPIRNKRMLETSKPDLILAFPMPNSVGTWDLVQAAKRRNERLAQEGLPYPEIQVIKSLSTGVEIDRIYPISIFNYDSDKMKANHVAIS